MIDLQMIDKGQSYKLLNSSYVIFICPVDVFMKGRHIYTFENIYKEDKSISLGDGAAKIFLNSDSEMDDVSEKLRAFLDYVAGKKTEDSFVEQLEEAVKRAKMNREWRHEYMTLLMRDQENIEKGIEKGKIYGAISMCRDLGLPEEEISKRLQQKYHLSQEEAEEYLQVEVV